MGATPPTLTGTYTFEGTTPADFKIKRPSGSAALYTTWATATYPTHFTGSGTSIVFENL
jgi:hypothetical protein